MRTEQSDDRELTRASLESHNASSDAFSSESTSKGNNFNYITQHIQNNNNKITIIIKHNDGQTVQPGFTSQIIYIQPAVASQPDLQTNRFNRSTTDLQISEIYNSLDDLDNEENYQFYDERAIDVPDNFKRDPHLVLNFNRAAHRKLRRRICTPTRNLMPINDTIDSQIIQGNNKRNQLILQKVDIKTKS